MLLFDVRKVLLIVAVAIFGLVCAFGIYWLFFKPQPSTPGYLDISGSGGAGGQLPQSGSGTGGGIAGDPGTLPGFGDTGSGAGGGDSGTGRLAPQIVPDVIARGSNTAVLPLNENRAMGVYLSSGDKGIVFYDRDEGKFYRLTEDGKKQLLSDKEFHSADNVAWSKDANKAIIEYPDGSNIYYDFEKDKAVTLPREMEEPSFSQAGEKIAFKFVTDNEDDNWLVTSSPDGEGMEALEPIGDRGYLVQVAWSPTSQIVAFYHKSAGLDKEEIFLIGRRGENFESFIVNGMGFEGVWSPKGDKVLYHVVSVLADYKPVLWVVDAKSGSIGSNNFNLGLYTWVNKCIFSSSGLVVYCAVPKELSTGAGLYPEASYIGSDVFYKINLENGSKNIIASPVLEDGLGSFDVGRVYLSKDESDLFFWDKVTERIYKMRLK